MRSAGRRPAKTRRAEGAPITQASAWIPPAGVRMGPDQGTAGVRIMLCCPIDRGEWKQMASMNPGAGLAERTAAEWDEAQRTVFDRAAGQCEDCGASGELDLVCTGILKNPRRAFAAENLVAVCGSCRARRGWWWEEPAPRGSALTGRLRIRGV